MTVIEIIEETVKYYSKNPSKRRGINPETSGCVYKSPTGQKCAVGKCGSSKFNFDFEGDVYEYISFQQQKNPNFELDDHLFPRYKGLSTEFWSDLQRFHDNDSNWDFENKRLSFTGEENTKWLKEKYATQ